MSTALLSPRAGGSSPSPLLSGSASVSVVSEKHPLDDDTRETRVLEIERLFDAADTAKRGYLDRGG